MAILFDDKKKKPIDLSTGMSAATIQPQGTTPQQTPQSGSFQNINKFIEQNKQGANRVAGELSSEAAKKTQSVREGIESNKQAYNQKVSGAQAAETGGEDFIKSAIENARQGTETQGDSLSRFQNLRTANLGDVDYDAQGLGDLAQKEKGALDYGQGLMTEPGRFSALQQLINRPSYTSGQQRLDQLLLQTTPGAKETLYSGAKGAIKDFGGLTQQALGQESAESQRLKDRIASLQQYSDTALKGALGSETEELGASAGTKRTDLQNQLGQYRDQLGEAINSGDTAKMREIIKSATGQDVSPEEFANLDKMANKDVLSNQFYEGMTPEQQQILRTYGASDQAGGGHTTDQVLNKYLESIRSTMNPEAFLAQKNYSDVDLGSAADQAQAKALGGLSGTDLLSQYGSLNQLVNREAVNPTAANYQKDALTAVQPGIQSAYDILQKNISKSREGAVQESLINKVQKDFYNANLTDIGKAISTQNPGIIADQLVQKYPGLSRGYAEAAANNIIQSARSVDPSLLSKYGISGRDAVGNFIRK